MTTIDLVGWTLIHFVWEGAAIGVVAALLLRALDRRSAQLRYLAARVALVAMVACLPATAMRLASMPPPDAHLIAGAEPARAAVFARETAVAQVAANERAATDTAVAGRVDAPRWTTIVVWLWAAGVMVMFGRMFGGWVCAARLHRRSRAAEASAWTRVGVRLAERLHIRAAIHIVESAAIDVPTVVGWLRPVIVLPAAALTALPPEQVEAILVHELAHIRRHDYLINLLQTAVETVLFYHPAVWWTSNQIRIEREHCCDDRAVGVCGNPVEYARALAALETWRVGTMALAMAATDGSLLSRVRRLLRVPTADSPGTAWLPMLALTAIFVAGAGGVVRLPSVFVHASGTTGPLTARVLASERALPFAAPGGIAPPAPRIADVAPDSFAQAPPAPPAPPVPPVPPVPPEPPTLSTPSEPPAPPAPPAPPVPPVPDLAFDGDTHIRSSSNGRVVEIMTHGEIELNADVTDVETLGEGAYLRLHAADDGTMQSVEISRRADGSIVRRYRVAGVEKPWDDRARAFFAEKLLQVVRSSGLGAPSRVRRLLAAGGAPAVLREVDALEADYARRVYLTLLMESSAFDSSSLLPVLTKIKDRIQSDYDRRVALTMAAERLPMNTAAADVYVQTVGLMSSDYDRRVALGAFVQKNQLTPELAQTIARSAANLGSDYDRRSVLQMALAAMSGGPSPAFFQAVDRMSSDYDRRVILEEVLRRPNLSTDTRRAVLASVKPIRSDFDRATVLLTFVRTQTVDSSMRESFLAAADEIRSQYDQDRVLAALARSERR